jgi:antitoxin HigA-1
LAEQESKASPSRLDRAKTILSSRSPSKEVSGHCKYFDRAGQQEGLMSMDTVRVVYRDDDRTPVIYCIKEMGAKHYGINVEVLKIKDYGEFEASLFVRRLPTKRPPTHPGEMLLEEFLKPLGISQSAFAVRLGISFPRLNEIIRGKRGVTSDTALRLAHVLGMSADFWLGLQQDWELWHALRSKKSAAIARLEPLRHTS